MAGRAPREGAFQAADPRPARSAQTASRFGDLGLLATSPFSINAINSELLPLRRSRSSLYPYVRRCRLRVIPAKPARPEARRRRVVGSGAAPATLIWLYRLSCG